LKGEYKGANYSSKGLDVVSSTDLSGAEIELSSEPGRGIYFEKN
jgi:hypothetical protein